MKLLIFMILIFQFVVFSFSAQLFRDNINEGELITYKLTEGNKIITFEERVSSYTTLNMDAHRLDVRGSDGGTSCYVYQKETLKPIYVVYYDLNGNKIKEISYSKDRIEVFIKENNVRYSYEINNRDVFDITSFFHLLRGFPFEKKEVIFNVFVPEIKRTVSFYVKQIGEDKIFANSSNNNCFLLEMGVAGVVESLICPQTFKFWITKNQPRLFLKYQGKSPIGSEQVTEVIKYSR